MSGELFEKGEEPRKSFSSRHDAQAEYERRASNIVAALDGHDVNASGHEDQLKRHFGFWSLCGLALTVDNAWIAFGGSIIIASYNGGPPGMLYELITAVFYYLFIGASLAELASALPTAGGVYHWASVTPGPRYGRMLGFFAGFINFFGWIFDLASICQITANVVVQMYAVYHPDLVIQPWHTYIAFVILTWTCSTYCIFFNRTLPLLQTIGMFFVIVGGFITIVVLAAMPTQHASTDFVWKEWDNQTGWGSGVAFLAGVLNGAFTIGTPDAITHMAEELPNPRTDLPKAIMLQIGLGGLSAFFFAIALLYGITDFGAVLSSNGAFPLATAYFQATNGSQGATFGLLFIVFVSILICLIGTFLTLSRIWWALARDHATPFPRLFSSVNTNLSCPIPAMILTAVLCTGLGAISLGSKTAFSDLAGSFIILTSTSYVMAIAPHLLTGRKSVPPGPFWMGKAGPFVQAAACLLIIFFNIMYCFPFALPVTVQAMNYNSVILVGCFVLTGIWWLVYGMRSYPGPKLTGLYVEGVEAKTG